MTHDPSIPTRGERNNNPGNIDYVENPANAWDGQLGIEIVPDGESYAARFGRYITSAKGLRAMCKQLVIDNTRHGLKTIATIVGDETWGWAPAADRNDPDAYAATVTAQSGIDVDEPVDLTDPTQLRAVLPGFILEENSRCLYDDATLQDAVDEALS